MKSLSEVNTKFKFTEIGSKSTALQGEIRAEDIFSASMFENDLLLLHLGGIFLKYLPIYRTQEIDFENVPVFGSSTEECTILELSRKGGKLFSENKKTVPLHPRLMGLEIGITHGYFLVGPFVTFCPFAGIEDSAILGAISVIGLILINTFALWSYGQVTFVTELEYYLSLKELSFKLYKHHDEQIEFLNFALMKREFENTYNLRLETSKGWNEFTLGVLTGGITGAVLAATILILVG